jgi:hypothetical protein
MGVKVREKYSFRYLLKRLLYDMIRSISGEREEPRFNPSSAI